MSIPAYQSRVQFQPVNVGGMFQQAFQQARNSALAERELERRAAQDEQDRLTYGPLKLEAAKLGLESQKLGIESSRQNLENARRKAEADNAEIELNKQYGGMVDRILGETADTWNGSAEPATGGAVFGGIPISTSYKGAKVSHFAGDATMTDPIDNSRGAWGADTSKVAGVAVPEKILKQLYGDPNNRDENGHFKGGKVRVNARMADGTMKEVVVPIVDKGTAEWVWKRDGAKLDMTTTLAKELGASVSKNNMSGIDAVDFDFLDADGNPLAGGPQPSQVPKHLAPIEGSSDFPAKLKKYEEITRAMTSGAITDKNSLRRLATAKLAIEMDPVFMPNVRLHQAELQRQQVASNLGTAMTAANPAAAADFKATYAQWAGVTLAPDANGGYHPVKADGSKLSIPELAAFDASWQGFVKDWKPGNSFRMNSEQSRALTAFKSAEAVYKLNPKDTEAAAKFEGSKAALVALGTAAPEFGRVVAGQLPMPAPAPKADAPPPPGAPPADAPLSLDDITEDGPDNTAINEEWSAAKDQVAERIGAAFNATAADGKIASPTRLLPELNPETVKATLRKTGPLTQKEKALKGTLLKAKAILTNTPMKTGAMIMRGTMGGAGGEVAEEIPAADFYAKEMKSFTIDGKEIPAADVLRAWAEEVFDRAGIPLKQAKTEEIAPIKVGETRTLPGGITIKAEPTPSA